MSANQLTPPREWEPPSKTEAEKLRPKGVEDQRQIPLLELPAIPKPKRKPRRRR